MKAKLIREMEATADAPKDGPKVRTVTRDGEKVKRRVWPEGSVIEHQQAYLLVQMGVAEPADKECDEAAGLTKEQRQAAQYAYERQSRGIRPEDFPLYDRGVIEGYNDDGSYKPGPNFSELDADDDEPEPKPRKKT